jgi:hypothetical protein
MRTSKLRLDDTCREGPTKASLLDASNNRAAATADLRFSIVTIDREQRKRRSKVGVGREEREEDGNEIY